MVIKLPISVRERHLLLARFSKNQVSIGNSECRNHIESEKNPEYQMGPDGMNPCLDEILSRVFDISSQSKQKLKSSKSTLIKIVYPNPLHGCDFLCFNSTKYYN